jgi:hypothetical protein
VDSIDDYGFRPDDDNDISRMRRWTTLSVLLGVIGMFSMLVVLAISVFGLAMAFPLMDRVALPLSPFATVALSVAAYGSLIAGGAGVVAGLTALVRREAILAPIVGAVLSGFAFLVGLAALKGG